MPSRRKLLMDIGPRPFADGPVLVVSSTSITKLLHWCDPHVYVGTTCTTPVTLRHPVYRLIRCCVFVGERKNEFMRDPCDGLVGELMIGDACIDALRASSSVEEACGMAMRGDRPRKREFTPLFLVRAGSAPSVVDVTEGVLAVLMPPLSASSTDRLSALSRP